MANIIVDIEQGELESAYIVAPFDEGKEALEKAGYRIISLEEDAMLRIQEGKDSNISRNGNWTREGVIYVPKKGVFLTKNSPIMDNAKEAVDCYSIGNNFYLTNSQVEKALEDSVELKNEDIPTNRFKDSKIAVYAFGDVAKKYGQFLRNAGIKEMSVLLADMQDESFARQLWFGNLDLFELDGKDSYLSNGSRVRGVRKSSEVYTPKQIADALKDLGFPQLEKGLVGKLRQ